jgi:hypothetical protein
MVDKGKRVDGVNGLLSQKIARSGGSCDFGDVYKIGTKEALLF